MLKKIMFLSLIVLLVVSFMIPATFAKPVSSPSPAPTPVAKTPISIYGVWHAGNHYCDWTLPRNMTEFDTNNHWLIDRGDGSGLPSVNLVVLSFVHPLQLMNKVNDAVTVNGIPIGMSQDVVNYFKSHNVQVMLSIGGISYTGAWDTALATNPTQLALNAVAASKALGVGIEIDYENSSSPNLAGLQTFVSTYRSQIPYNPNDPSARLTIDLGAGDRWLIDLCRYATQNWLTCANPVLDWANAMVGGTSSGTPTDWQEHITGKSNYSPVIPPLAPCKLTGGLYLKGGIANCTNFASSEQYADANFVQTVKPNGAGTTAGMLGFMFWAVEYPSSRGGYVATVPPNTCENGMGKGASTFNIPVPIPVLRQQ